MAIMSLVTCFKTGYLNVNKIVILVRMCDIVSVTNFPTICLMLSCVNTLIEILNVKLIIVIMSTYVIQCVL